MSCFGDRRRGPRLFNPGAPARFELAGLGALPRLLVRAARVSDLADLPGNAIALTDEMAMSSRCL